MAKLPAIQFYPGDWRKSTDVQSLSYHDRGVWIEILCLMFESSERGKLIINGKPMSDDTLARILGIPKKTLEKTIANLLEAGVASRDEQGALVNRRMVRDEEKRETDRKNGKRGGNPNLVKPKATDPLTQNGENGVNPKSTTSSSSSSSSSTTIKNSGGGEPQTAADSSSNGESNEDYLERKQREYPLHDVKTVYRDFKSKCGSDKYPNLKNTRTQFDRWLANESPPLEINVERQTYVDPLSGEALR